MFDSTYRHEKKLVVKFNGVNFPSDETIKETMQKILQGNPELAKVYKIPKRLIVPKEFRESLFGQSFYTTVNKGEDNQSPKSTYPSEDHYLQFICGFPRLKDFQEDIDEREVDLARYDII